jgi:Flp pilus assembly protein TadG
MGLLAWLNAGPHHTKRAVRYLRPPMAAYWWDGGTPTARQIRDISTTGAFLYTSERWYPGTILTVTLQEERQDQSTNATLSISLPCKVVRHHPDGVGVQFMFSKKQDQRAVERFVHDVVVKGRERGQALVEFALMVPMLILLMLYAVNFGGLFYSWITVANAVRSAGQYAAMGLSSVGPAGPPPLATMSQITTLIQNETASLPGSTPTVTVCLNDGVNTPTNLSGSAACPANVTAPPADPESGYVSVTVDVTYTYTPFFNITSFLRFPMALPPTNVHRRLVMRALN